MTTVVSNTRLTGVKIITTHMISIISCALITGCYWLQEIQLLKLSLIKYDMQFCWLMWDYKLTRSLRYGISSPFIGVHCSISLIHVFERGHQPQRWVWTHDSHVDCWLHWTYIPLTWDLLSSGQRLHNYFFNIYYLTVMIFIKKMYLFVSILTTSLPVCRFKIYAGCHSWDIRKW